MYVLKSKSELCCCSLCQYSPRRICALHHLITGCSVLGSSSDWEILWHFPSKFLIISAPLIEKDRLALRLCNSSSGKKLRGHMSAHSLAPSIDLSLPVLAMHCLSLFPHFHSQPLTPECQSPDLVFS